jgi:Mg-chelatase subunit ChlD
MRQPDTNNDDDGQDVYVLVDRSGSMGPLASTVVDEVNRLIATLRTEAPNTMLTIGAFDSDVGLDVLVDATPVRRVRRWTAEDFVPDGGTPLFDALADMIRLATKAAVEHDRTRARRRILVAVITDGEENDSVRTTALQLAGKLRRRKAAGWEFLYLGAGRPFADANRIGFDPADVQPWHADELGTRAAFATITRTALGCHNHS